MTTTDVDSFLTTLFGEESEIKHYGTPGMKWGVRKDKGHEGERAKTKKIAKLDKKFEKNAANSWWKVNNAAADKMNNGEIDRINNKPEYKNADFNQDSPLRRQYYKEHADTMTKHLNDASDKIIGTNASGTRKLTFKVDEEDLGLNMYFDDVKHSADDEAAFYAPFDAKGKIESIEVVGDELMQSDLIKEDDYIAHYGVPGMRWGVRRNRAERAARRAEWKAKKNAPKPIEVKTKPGQKVEAKGGQKAKPSEDAIKAAISRQKAKASTTDALSNDELKQLVERMNLEANYSRLSSGRGKTRKEIGLEFANEFIKDAGEGAVTSYAGKKYGAVGQKAVELTFEAMRKTDPKNQGKK